MSGKTNVKLTIQIILTILVLFFGFLVLLIPLIMEDINNMNSLLSILVFFVGLIAVWGLPWGMKMFMSFQKNIEKIAESREKIRNCIKCGRSIPWDANLCPYCGHDYKESDSQTNNPYKV